MNRVTPAGYISTNDAIDDMLGADIEWRKLSDARTKSERQWDESWQEVSARQTLLTDALRAAVAAREISAFALVFTGNGEWVENDLPRTYWSDVNGDLALFKGVVDGLGLASLDRDRFGGAALCFRRLEWDRWLAARNPAPEPAAEKPLEASSLKPSIEAGQAMTDQSSGTDASTSSSFPEADEKTVRAWLVVEQARRIKEGEQHGLSQVRLFLKDEFPHLSRQDADRFYEGLDKSLKPRSGPRGPWKNKR